jgi:hypothetical protein
LDSPIFWLALGDNLDFYAGIGLIKQPQRDIQVTEMVCADAKQSG